MKQNFILFASTTTVDIVPDKPSAELKLIFESRTDQQVQSIVHHSIITQWGGSQVVDNAYSMALYNRTFHNAENNRPPRGLSMFFAIPAPNIGGTSTMSTEELDLCIKGNLLTPALILKLTASQVQIPKNDHGFRATLENHLCAIDFASTKESILLQAVEHHSQRYL